MNCCNHKGLFQIVDWYRREGLTRREVLPSTANEKDKVYESSYRTAAEKEKDSQVENEEQSKSNLKAGASWKFCTGNVNKL